MDYFEIPEEINKRYSCADVYPSRELVFRAFKLTPPQSVKVVILGQDPYHSPGLADGLAFSSSKIDYIPLSLRNIFKELKDDLGIENRHADLSYWAHQGVFLLNTVLTVEKGRPGSHENKGWEPLINTTLKALAASPRPIVWMLWGKQAKSYRKLIEGNPEHLILEAAHPSPFSAYNGFMGCKHFSEANKFLSDKGLRQIDWRT